MNRTVCRVGILFLAAKLLGKVMVILEDSDLGNDSDYSVDDGGDHDNEHLLNAHCILGTELGLLCSSVSICQLPSLSVYFLLLHNQLP